MSRQEEQTQTRRKTYVREIMFARISERVKSNDKFLKYYLGSVAKII